MPSRVIASAIDSLVLVMVIALWSLSAMAAVPEASVEFQDGDGNTAQSFTPGQVAAFYIKDSSLATIATSTATWTRISARVAAGAPWSLTTGEPRAAAYSLSQGSAYDTATPANTPLSAVPTPRVNGVPALVATFNHLTGEFTLLNNVNASSTLQVDFAFDIVDSFLATQHSARVTSTSDIDGEWVAIREVASEINASPSPTSGLFRGGVLLREDIAVSGFGDGVVYVQPGDSLTVTYFDADGSTVLDTYQVRIDPPESSQTPTAVPFASWLSLVLLSVMFTIMMARQRHRLDSGA